MRKIWIICFLFQAFLLHAQKINQIEYFVDTDPGYNMAHQLPITSDSLIDTTFILGIDTLTTGLHTLYIRAKDDSSRWSLTQKHLFFKSNGLVNPQVTAMEYFFDVDPGYDSAYPITIGAPAKDLSIPLNLVIDTLSTGLHTLYVRAKADNDYWSLTQKHTFFKSNGLINPQVTQLEYYFDTDPGLGIATQIPIVSQTEIDTSIVINVDSLTSGLHTLYIRAKADNEHWSITQKHTFFKVSGNLNPQITAVEYFLDNDPGYGNATQLSVTPNGEIDTTFNLDLMNLSTGLHTLYIRSLGDNGYWSLTQKHTFLVTPGMGGTKEIVQLEYFWDIDPGYGNGIQVDISGQPTPHDTLDFAFNVSMVGLDSGLHTLNLRAKDEANFWSLIHVEEINNDSSDGKFPIIVLQKDTIGLVTLDCITSSFDSIQINNTGESVLNVAISESISWLTVSPLNASIADGDSTSLLLEFNPTGLASGIYSEMVEVLSTDPNSPIDTFYVEFELLGQPLLSVSDTLIDFGQVQLTTNNNQALTIQNLGCDTLTVDSILISGLAFTIPSIMDSALVSGNSLALDITFLPTQDTIYEEVISIHSNNQIDSVIVQGSGLAIPDIDVQPLALSFSTDICDSTHQEILTIHNTGDGVLAWSINNALPNWLSLSSITDSVPSLDSLQITITFSSTNLVNGIYNHNLIIDSNDPDESQITVPVSLTLNGQAEFQVNATSLDAGEVFVGYNSNTGFTITNDGCETLVIDTFSFLTSQFTYFDPGYSPLPYSILPGVTHQFFVNFAPDSVGTFSDSIMIVSDIGTETIPINGVGKGVPVLSLSQSQIDTTFTTCNDSTTFSITLENTGEGDLIIVIPTPPYPNWVQPSAVSDTLMANETVIWDVTIDANNIGNGIYNQNLIIWTNEPSGGTVNFPVNLQVDGTSTFSTSASLLDFGMINLGGLGQQTLTIQNDGCDSITINNLNFDKPEFSTSSSTPILILPFSSTNITVDFNPTATGGFTGALTIETDAGNQSVNLVGVACPTALSINQPDTTLCAPDTVMLSTNLTNDILWSTGDSTSVIEVAQVGSFSATYSDSYGCMLISNTVTVDTFLAAYIEVVDFSTVCAGDPATLTGHNASIFNWSTGQSSGTITVNPTNATTYTLTAENLAGCIYEDSVEIIVIPVSAPSMVGNMLPMDGVTDLDLPLSFSWLPSTNTTHYDVFIWEQGTSQPVNPTISNLTQISTFYSSLNYGTTYDWQVVSKNSCLETSSATQDFSIRDLPDLTISNITAPSTASSEQEIGIDWTVKNDGDGETVGNWTDYIYLSTDEIINGGDYTLGSFGNFAALMSNESYTQMSQLVTIPQGVSGNFFIIVNSSGELESDYSNNKSTFPITITLAPPPDLQVTSVIASPSNQFSGQDITVNYEVTNLGTGPTVVSNWIDAVYLSDNPILNVNNATFIKTISHSGILKKDSLYTSSTSFSLPLTISGNYYVHIITDFSDAVFEATQNNNNTGVSGAINVILAPTPDLQVSNITIPSEASNKQSVSFQWTLQNMGGAATQNSWHDGIYLSPDSTDYTLINAFPIATKYQSSTLNAGASQGTFNNFNLPTNLAGGDYYVYVKADRYNSVFEYLNEQNNVARSDTSIKIVNPDLIVSNIGVPVNVNSGESINLNWTVKNQGGGGVFNTSWRDNIYISSHNVFNSNSVTYLGNYNHSNLILLSGDSVTRQKTVTIPNGISGTYYFYVKTDVIGNVFEYTNELNNTGQTSTNMVLSDWIDLEPQNLVVPDTLFAGNLANFSFDITNSGLTDLNNGTWKDRIYISPSPVFLQSNSTYLGAFSRSQSLVLNEILSTNTQLIIPTNLSSGTYYIHLITDYENDIFEHTDETNNIITSATVEYIDYPPVDLEVITARTDETSVFSGMPIEINWSVKNSSLISTIANKWDDVLYLSSDMILDGSDILVEEWEEIGQLDSNEVYARTQNPILPNGLSGMYYLLLSSDDTQKHNDSNLANNMKVLTDSLNNPVLLDIQLTPPSDLVISSATLPNQGTSGQPINVTFKVENQGTGITTAGSWKDQLYLSTDFQINANDIQLETFTRNENLGNGLDYEVTGQAFIPITASGNYILILKTDDDNNQYEHNAENNNEYYSNIYVTQPPPSDLMVTEVIVPTMEYAGENATVSWTLKNDGTNTAAGYLREAVYLSTDTLWDSSDILFGVKEGNINIAAQGEQNRNLAGTLTGVSVDHYYGIVRTDILNNILESDDNNNSKTSETTLQISVPELPLDTLITDDLFNELELYYRIEIPDSLAGETMSVMLTCNAATNASNELYLRYGQVPTRSVHDFNFPNPFAPDQQILVPSIQAGTYYVMVYGVSPLVNQQSVDLFAEIMEFSILSVQDDQGGNTGSVTVKIKGSKFEENMTAKLYDNSLGTITAQTIYYTNTTELFATFNLSGASEGFYDVVLEKMNGDTAMLTNGFEVITGSPSVTGSNGNSGFVCEISNIGYDNVFDTAVEHPASTRPSRVVAITIYFANEGNVDIAVPTRFLVSLTGTPLGFSISDFAQNNQELLLEFDEIGGPPGILRPGGSGSIIIYSRAGLNDMRFAIIE